MSKMVLYLGYSRRLKLLTLSIELKDYPNGLLKNRKSQFPESMIPNFQIVKDWARNQVSELYMGGGE